jgi:hypothetical protein
MEFLLPVMPGRCAEVDTFCGAVRIHDSLATKIDCETTTHMNSCGQPIGSHFVRTVILWRLEDMSACQQTLSLNRRVTLAPLPTLAPVPTVHNWLQQNTVS